MVLQLIHESTSVEFLLESVRLPALTRSQGTPSFSFPRLCYHSCPAEHTLHPNSISMATHIMYIGHFKVCVCVSFSLSFHPYLSGLWTTTTFERQRQQIRGFPSRPLVAQATFLSTNISPNSSLHTRGSPRNSDRLSWRVVVVVAIVVAASQQVCTGESTPTVPASPCCLPTTHLK